MKRTVPVLLAAGAFGLSAMAARTAPPAKPPKKPERIAGSLAFRPPDLDLAPGETYLTELLVPSPTGSTYEGQLRFAAEEGITVRPDARFTGRVPAWGVKTYPRVTAAPAASGERRVTAALPKGRPAVLTVRVAPPEVQVTPEQGRLVVRLTSPFRRRQLLGVVKVANPDRFLQDITSREFRIAPGRSQELVFPLPGAAPAEGETYDFTIEIRSYHGYRSRQTYPLSFPPQEEKLL